MVPDDAVWHHRGIGTTFPDPTLVSPASRDHGRRSFRLVRSRTDRIVGGVATGLGDQLGVDHVVIRLAFVVLAFAGGVGAVAYLVLWLLSTEVDAVPRVVEDRRT